MGSYANAWCTKMPGRLRVSAACLLAPACFPGKGGRSMLDLASSSELPSMVVRAGRRRHWMRRYFARARCLCNSPAPASHCHRYLVPVQVAPGIPDLARAAESSAHAMSEDSDGNEWDLLLPPDDLELDSVPGSLAGEDDDPGAPLALHMHWQSRFPGRLLSVTDLEAAWLAICRVGRGI